MKTVAVVFSGNITGAGKTTVSRQVIELEPRLRRVVSFATREKRPDEVDGIDYNFVTTERFIQMREEGDFHEFTDEIAGRFYGVPQAPIDEAFANNDIPCFVTDFRGIENLAAVADTVVKFWITAPHDQLESRIRAREKTEPEIVKRLQALQDEKDWFQNKRPNDLVIIQNLDGQLDAAVQRCYQIVKEL